MILKNLNVSYNNKSIDIPYIEIVWNNKWPHIFISWWMHWSEVWWIAVVEIFIKRIKYIDVNKLNGKITIIPVLNPSWFSKMQRRVKEDGKDLNRCFWLNKITSISEKVALELEKEIFSKTEFWIDFHDAWWWAILMPHSRVHYNEKNNITRKMWQLFNTKIIVERKWNDNMMAVALLKKYWVRVLTLELWWAQKIFNEYVQIWLQWIKNILSYHKMYPWEIILPDEQYLLKKRFWVSLKKPAIIRFSKKIWDYIHEWEILWESYFPTEQKTEYIIAPMCWYIFSLRKKNQVPLVTKNKTKIIYSILHIDKCEHSTKKYKNSIVNLEKLVIKEIIM